MITRRGIQKKEEDGEKKVSTLEMSDSEHWKNNEEKLWSMLLFSEPIQTIVFVYLYASKIDRRKKNSHQTHSTHNLHVFIYKNGQIQAHSSLLISCSMLYIYIYILIISTHLIHSVFRMKKENIPEIVPFILLLC